MSDVTKSNKNTLLAAGADYSTLIHIDRITDNTGTKQGLVVDGGLTDDLQPTLSGYLPGSEGLQIRVFLNGSVAGYTEVEADGTWSFTPETPLIAGTENAFQVSLIDPANGNTQWLSNEYNITTTEPNQDASAPPAAPVIDSVVDSVAGYKGFTGGLKDGGLTNDAHPALSGHAEAGSTVNIYDNGKLLGSVTATDNGTWTFTPDTALPDGTHTLTVTASNAAGESTATDFSIMVDTTIIKPVLDSVTDDQGSATGIVANGGATDDSRPVLTGHAEANSRVDIHVFGPNGKQMYYQSVTAGEDGTWSYQPKAFTTQGTYSFGISGVDKAGNAWQDYGDKYSIQFVGENQDDTTAPDAPQITAGYDNAGSAVGDLANGATTDDTTPALRGTAEANSLVTIYDNGNEIGTVIAAADGSWNYTPSARPEGSHTFTATATDAAGNTSASSAGFEMNIVTDTTAPDAPVITAVFDSVGEAFGEVERGGKTDDTTPTIIGTGEVNSIVYLSIDGPGINGQGLGSVQVGSSGQWRFDVPDSSQAFLAEGAYFIRAVAADAAGNFSEISGSYSIMRVSSGMDDTTAPDAPQITAAHDDAGSATGELNNGATTDDTTPALRGTAEANSIVKIYDNGNAIGSVQAGSDGSWNYTPSARGEGKHTFTATATDEEGNTSASSAGFEMNIVTDTTAPDAPVITALLDNVGETVGDVERGGKTDDTTPTIIGTGEANSIVFLSIDGPGINGQGLGSVQVNSSGQWRFDVPDSSQAFLAEGAYFIRAVAADAAGNFSEISGSYSMMRVSSDMDDTTAPDAPVITNVYDDAGSQQWDVANGGLTDDSQPLISGTAEAGSIVTLTRLGPAGGNYVVGSATANSSGHWEIQTQNNAGHLGNLGYYTYTATAKDAAGNKSASSDAYKVKFVSGNQDDTVAPAAPTITSGFDSAGATTGNFKSGATTDDTTPKLSGKAEANSIVNIYDNGKAIGSVQAGSDGSWNYTPSARGEGKHTFTATATDEAGNTSGKSGGFVVNVDTHTSVTIDGLMDAAGAKTGLVPDGGKSDDLHPTLKGTAEPGSTIHISESVPSTGYTYSTTVQTNSNGQWEWPFGVLQLGTHNISVYAVDAAGNKSAVKDYSFERVAENYDLPEAYSWNFNDKTTQGWTLVDENAKSGNVSFRNGRIYFNTNSELGTDYSGDVMKTTILVRAGQTYNFEFAYGRNEDAVDTGARALVAMTVNGKAVTSYETAQNGVTYVKGSWTAQTSGEVVLAFNDKTSNAVGNDFWLDSINVAQSNVNLQGQSLQHSSGLLDTDVQQAGDELHNAQTSVITLSEAIEQQGTTANITDHQQTTLKLSLNDILSEAHDNLFIQDGKQQLAITGDAGDVVELKVEDITHDWQDAGQVTAGGVQYEVYQHADLNVELLVQQGVELQQVS